jgi:hypothetical protein
VAIDQLLPGVAESVQVHLRGLELRINMGAHVPEFENSAAADPIRLLNWGQRERLVSLVWGRHDGWRRGGRHRVLRRLLPEQLYKKLALGLR